MNLDKALEVYVIRPETCVEEGKVLDPNTESIAKISGAMAARGMDFHVLGDQAPFGIEWRDVGGRYQVPAGHAIVRYGDDFIPALVA